MLTGGGRLQRSHRTPSRRLLAVHGGTLHVYRHTTLFVRKVRSRSRRQRCTNCGKQSLRPWVGVGFMSTLAEPPHFPALFVHSTVQYDMYIACKTRLLGVLDSFVYATLVRCKIPHTREAYIRYMHGTKTTLLLDPPVDGYHILYCYLKREWIGRRNRDAALRCPALCSRPVYPGVQAVLSPRRP